MENKLNTNKSFDCSNLCVQCEKFNENSTNIWNELRNEEKLSDGVIRLNDGDCIKVNRTILSVSSRYFKACFTYSNTKSNTNETEISVDTTKNILNLILDFVYTGNCEITWENIEELLLAADRFEILGLLKQCNKFLNSELKPSNAIGIYLFAKQYFCNDLIELSKNYILINFHKIINESDELNQINFDDLHFLLNNERLNVNDEELVFNVIKNWIEFDPIERTNKLSKLLYCVRFGLMGYKFFRGSFLSWSPIKTEPNCRKILNHVLTYLAEANLSPIKRICGDYFYQFSRPRIPYQVIMVIGGWARGSPTNIIEVYDTRANCWMRMNLTDGRRSYHGVCAIGSKVYVIGGFDGSNHYNSMRCYDTLAYTWEEKACMYSPRCYVSVLAHQNKIYAIGGYNGFTRLDSVERYDPNRNQWEIIAPLNRLRSDAGSASLKDYIYIVGGFNGHEILNSCEMYNPKFNQWTLISFMLSPRSGVSLVTCNDTLYAIGGFNGRLRLNTVEKYSLNDPNWNYVAEMMVPRSNFASVCIENIIYVIGGFNGQHTTSFVEIYDPKVNAWQSATQMNICRSALAACVLTGLENIQGYSRHAHELDFSPCTYCIPNAIDSGDQMNTSSDDISDILDGFQTDGE